jgi:centriolar protein POC1
MSINIWDIRA